MNARPEADSTGGDSTAAPNGTPGKAARFDWRARKPRGDNPSVLKRLQGVRLKPVTVLFGALSLVWLFIGGWFVVGSDPMGGEPTAVAAIPEDASSTTRLAADGSPLQDATEAQPALGDPSLQVVRSSENGAGIIRISDPLSASLYEEGLIERTRYGPLPIIAEDGRRSFQAYAGRSPQEDTGAPRIALILTGMGLSAASTDSAIRTLPPEVTLAFAPYGRDLARLTAAARRDGHEIMLQVPLEPFDYPDNDPGPHTLLTSIPERQNIDRLHWVMGRIAGYVGIINHMGARFSSNAESMRPFLEETRNRGLIYVDDGAVAQSQTEEIADRIGLPAQIGDVIIDANPSRAKINEALDGLVELARDRGHAIGVAAGLPSTLQVLRPWLEEVQARGIVLVPVTAMIDITGA